METAIAHDTSPSSPPRHPIPAARCIYDIKVTVSPDSRDAHSIVVLEWTDAVNERQRQDFYGLTADQIAIDLHAATVCGEVPRRFFLTGLIRGLYIERRLT